MSDTILVSVQSGVMELRLDRPSKLNAVTPEMTAAIGDAVAQATRDEDVRCLLVSAAGRAFCAGRDLASAEANEDGTASDGKHEGAPLRSSCCILPRCISVRRRP